MIQGDNMTIKKIHTSRAPEPIGPYSQAVVAGDYVFLSGQIGIDHATGMLVGQGIKEQTIQTIHNIQAVLEHIGLGLKDIVRVDVFVTDIKEAKDVNEIYSKRFTQDTKPARATVQVVRLPIDAKIEISAIAYKGDNHA